MAVIGGDVPPAPAFDRAYQPLPPVAEEAATWKPTKLPWWRKCIAAAASAVALFIFWNAAERTDLTALVGGGTVSEAGWDALRMYGLFIVALLVVVAAIGRRSPPPTLVQTPVEKRRLSKRTLTATVLILLCIPATLFIG